MIKNIVIIDDSEFKRENILEYLTALLPDATVSEHEYANSGLLAVFNSKDAIWEKPEEWLVVTDMIMPICEGNQLERDGGKHVLSELDRLELRCPAIVVSSDATSLDNMRNIYENTIGCVKNDPVVYQASLYKEILANYLD